MRRLAMGGPQSTTVRFPMRRPNKRTTKEENIRAEVITTLQLEAKVRRKIGGVKYAHATYGTIAGFFHSALEMPEYD